MSTTTIKVNPAALRTQHFRPCDPQFIRDVCHARCCRSSTDPTGIAVTVTPAEVPAMLRRGAHVTPDRRLIPVERRCPFEQPDSHLCLLHTTGDKPLGCTISPFTLNANNTLIVRNRYRLLPCYRAEGAQPVTLAHREALEALLGAEQAHAVARAVLDGQDDPLWLQVPTEVAEHIHHKNRTSRSPR